MSEKGFVYVAINESIPGKIKVGMSSRVPEKRMDELSNTSVPTQFYCIYSVFVEDAYGSEKIIHKELNEYRTNSNREFFNTDPAKAITTIQASLKILYEDFHELDSSIKDKFLVNTADLNNKEKVENKKWHGVYSGDWVDGKPHGRGKWTSPNNLNIYEGDWVDGEYHGHGKLTEDNGDGYEGDWVENVPCKGKSTCQNGDFFEGDYDGGNPATGTMRETYAGGDVYEGEYVDGKRHGKGKYTRPSDWTYAGDWVDGEYHGKGNMTWPEGDVYEGEWSNDKRHGTGKQTWPDGQFYEGEWANDKRHGWGKLTFSNGDVYEGEWRYHYKWDKSEEGIDISSLSDKDIETGDRAFDQVIENDGWVEDEPSEKGKLTWPNGHSYEGELVNGKPHGNGKLTSPSGLVYEGRWVDGLFQENDK